MNEQTARTVLLVQTLEELDNGSSGPDKTRYFNADDLRYANQVAKDLVHWEALDQANNQNTQGDNAFKETWIAQRAQLLSQKLQQREPALWRLVQSLQWHRWWLVLVPLFAFVFGALSQYADHLTLERQRISLLAFPLLGVVVWNIAIFVALLMHQIQNAFKWMRQSATKESTPTQMMSSGLRYALTKLLQPRVSLNAARRRLTAAQREHGMTAVALFYERWLQMTFSILKAKVARTLHLSAALFAAAAVLTLYLLALVFEYRVGWESTFLQAESVHRVLSFLLAPASLLSGIQLPSVQELQTLRFSVNAPSTGENAARFIHLYALTVVLLVVAPRLLLAGIAHGFARHRANIQLDLQHPYYQRLLANATDTPQQLRVIPYSVTLNEAAVKNLKQLARHWLGENADLNLLTAIKYGDVDFANSLLIASAANTPITAVIFSLAATPEREVHGALWMTLNKALKQNLFMLLDESGYRERLGSWAEQRVEERRILWQSFAQSLNTQAIAVDLHNLDLVKIDQNFSRYSATRLNTETPTENTF